MQGTRMVPLTSVPSEFAGRVLVAKLGSAGIIAEVRGVSRVYPAVLGSPSVWVEAGEWSDARELISVDLDDELAAVADTAASRPAPLLPARVVVAVALVLLASFVIGMRSCGTATSSTPTSVTR